MSLNIFISKKMNENENINIDMKKILGYAHLIDHYNCDQKQGYLGNLHLVSKRLMFLFLELLLYYLSIHFLTIIDYLYFLVHKYTKNITLNINVNWNLISFSTLVHHCLDKTFNKV